MNKQDIINLLAEHENKEHVEQFAAYCIRLKLEKDKKKGGLKNPWMQKKTAEDMVALFKRVNDEGLVFDGKHVTLGNRGISYDYVAYKNKMLLAYPETELNFNAVFEGDDFSFEVVDGRVAYHHSLNSPFNKDLSKVIGAYCVIKNKRGHFLVTLDAEEIRKHRAVAQTDSIWKAWFLEMVYKTVIKKACKYHFNDIYERLDNDDNAAGYDLENPVDIDISIKEDVEEQSTLHGLQFLMKKYAGNAAAMQLIAKREQELTAGE